MTSAEKLRVRLCSTSNGASTINEYDGEMLFREGRYMIKYTADGVNTSIKPNDDEIIVISSGDGVDHRLTVKNGGSSVGVMGGTPFTVEGRRATHSFDGQVGEIRMNYLLPDLGDEPMEFNIRITFEKISL